MPLPQQSSLYTVTYLGACDYRQSSDWLLDLLATCVHHSELHFTVHCQRLVCPQSIAISTSCFLATDLIQWRFFSFPRSGPLVRTARAELLSTDNTIERPFHSSLLVCPSQADFQLTAELSYQPTRYFTQLNC
jgi:hypothetical protein